MNFDPQPSRPDVDPFARESANPYAPTSLVAAETPMLSEVEAYRRRYLNHEASVKSVGSLYMFGAVLNRPTHSVVVTVRHFAGRPLTGAVFRLLVNQHSHRRRFQIIELP